METELETATRKKEYWMRKRYCNWVGIVLGLLVVAPIFILLFDRREPVTLHWGKFVPELLAPGGMVVIVWEATENIAGCDGDLERRITEVESGKEHTFKREPTTYHLVGPSGGRQTFSKDFKLPDSISEGLSDYWTVGRRWCNLLQKYIWPKEFIGPKIRFMVQAKPTPPAFVVIETPLAASVPPLAKPTPPTRRRTKRR